MKIRFSVVLAATLAVVAAGCDVRVSDKGGVSLDINEGGRAEDESTQSYPLAKGGHLELETDNGNIELKGAAGSTVEVHATRKVRAKTDEEARALLKQQYFTVETAPDRVTVRSVKREGVDVFRRQVRVDYRVSVPAGSTVTIKSENGAVTLNNVEGRFKIGSTNGHIEGHKVSGGLELETVNGGVVMYMAAVTGDVRITSVNGGVTLGLPPKVNATVEATTVNGGVSVNEELGLVPTIRDRHRFSGRLGTGSGPRIELQTTNGGVRLGDADAPR